MGLPVACERTDSQWTVTVRDSLMAARPVLPAVRSLLNADQLALAMAAVGSSERPVVGRHVNAGSYRALRLRRVGGRLLAAVDQ